MASRARLMRLDRDATGANAAWERLKRGDVILVTPAPELERPRVTAASTVLTAEVGIVEAPVPGDAESR
jgi:hypothetical protein